MTGAQQQEVKAGDGQSVQILEEGEAQQDASCEAEAPSPYDFGKRQCRAAEDGAKAFERGGPGGHAEVGYQAPAAWLRHLSNRRDGKLFILNAGRARTRVWAPH